MPSSLSGLPILIRISALAIGSPLILFGLALMAVDVLGQLKLVTPAMEPLAGIALGPVFVLLGGSFLYPLLALRFQPKPARRG